MGITEATRVSWFWFLAERFADRLLRSRAWEEGGNAAATAGIFTTVRLTAQLKQSLDNKWDQNDWNRICKVIGTTESLFRQSSSKTRAYGYFEYAGIMLYGNRNKTKISIINDDCSFSN